MKSGINIKCTVHRKCAGHMYSSSVVCIAYILSIINALRACGKSCRMPKVAADDSTRIERCSVESITSKWNMYVTLCSEVHILPALETRPLLIFIDIEHSVPLNICYRYTMIACHSMAYILQLILCKSIFETYVTFKANIFHRKMRCVL